LEGDSEAEGEKKNNKEIKSSGGAGN